ncbi:TATA box-binding protein-associated factor RNA polymerase I subunit D isoform X2 [Varanus komodoensis]|uniref:TATA box-binding protein-associated factor RNA polymerase I subunit D isoform X2 n=1 Tax=Varanus komodoensis TaxID=61221 RepID=UPI001CF7EBDA|nr:TATA box-binding protein-associated factor RNA polymerase I subunit D isoform X2 [Varanus komodoensis]
MADSDEMESVSDSEGHNNGCSSENTAQLKTSLAGASPDNQVSEMTKSNLNSRNHSKKKVGAPALAKRAKYRQAQGQFKLPKPKIDLRALFDYHFRRKQDKNCKRWRPSNKARWKAPRKQSSKKRINKKKKRHPPKKRPLPFPLVEKIYGRKHLPLKMVELYELAALKGYFKYIEMLKYEHHLKKSLTQLNAGDELENECLESRKHKYLDDDGPLSPIQETKEDDPSENPDEQIGARVVDNSCFILSSKIPKKFKKKTSNYEVISTIPF